jgi:hypothetical protein
VRFRNSSPSNKTPLSVKKKIDLFPDEKSKMGTIDVIENIIKQEM